jgi:hypothetical protein
VPRRSESGRRIAMAVRLARGPARAPAASPDAQLLEAAQKGDLALLRRALATGADVDFYDRIFEWSA